MEAEAEEEIQCVEETKDEKKWRMISLLSYIIILICLGVPIWWHTTKVYRASLPLEEMLELKSSPAAPLFVDVCSSKLERAQLLSEELKFLLGETAMPRGCIQLQHVPASMAESDIEKAAANVLKYFRGNNTEKSEFGHSQVILIEWSGASHDFVLSSRSVIFFREGLSAYRLAAFLAQWPAVDLKTALYDPSRDNSLTDVTRALPAAPRYQVLLTVVNADPRNVNVDWDLVEDIQRYLEPYLSGFSDVVNLTVKSQWLYMVDLGVNLKPVGNHWMLAEQLLPHIITPLEKKLSSLVPKDPCINMVIYIPPCRTAPIHIYNEAGNRSPGEIDAFISPRWGGVIFANPDCVSHTLQPNSKLIFSTLITQLGQLLGLPNPKQTFSGEIYLVGKQPTDWQVGYILRAHTLQYLESAKLTLRSLSQLLLEISNIVINDDIADAVRLSLEKTTVAEHLLQENKYEEAFRAAQVAAMAAEAAFIHPSLLALLYFPDDQKYAVYIPLFLPIMIPVIMSLGPLTKWLRAKDVSTA